MSATLRGLSWAAASRCGRAASAQYSSAATLMSSIRHHSSVSPSTTGPSSIMPALLIRMSSRPSSEAVRSHGGVRLRPRRSRRPRAPARVPPPSRIRSASGSSRSMRRAAIATDAPVLGERERGRLADSARGAGDEGDGAVEGDPRRQSRRSQRNPTGAGAGASGLTGSPAGGSFSLKGTGARSFGVSGWNSEARYCACPRPGPSSNWPPL